MALPIRQLPRGTYTFPDGVELPIRGLSRAEAIQLRELGDDASAIEILCIAAATNATKEEATAWLQSTPQAEIEGLVNAIAKLSGLDADEGKDDAEGLHSAKLTELITSLQKISESLSAKSEV